MRIAVVSDIHSNLVALEAVLNAMGQVDAIWCLGDFVGYGPWPNECVTLMRERVSTAIAGNHDLAVIGGITTEDFNVEAARAAAWTEEQLTLESRDYLKSLLPSGSAEGVTLAHGSPREPVWEYVLDSRVAYVNLHELKTPLCLVGHTHVPSIFVKTEEGIAMGHMPDGSTHTLGEAPTIANPGSVGQPRDRDPRAAYLIYDSEARSLEWHRVAYDIRKTQKKMQKERLPEPFVERLSYGA